MTLKMLEFYDSIMSTVSNTVSVDGYVSRILEEDITVPVTIDGKRLVLPLTERLSNPKEGEIFFHPLKEDLMRGPSEVLEYLRKAIIAETSIESLAMMGNLLILAGSSESQKSLTPDQSEILDMASKADAETAKRFFKIAEKVDNDTLDTAMIRIYLKRGGKDPKDGKTYRWLATVSFPLYEALVKNPKSLLGVALRKRDQEAMQEVMQGVFPGIDTEHQFSYGSNSVQAPKLEALLGALFNLRSQTNVILDLMKGPELFHEIDIPDTRWGAALGALEIFKKEVLFVPMQEGNEGREDVHEAQGAHANLALEHSTSPFARKVLAEPEVYETASRVAPLSPLEPTTSGMRPFSSLRREPVRGREPVPDSRRGAVQPRRAEPARGHSRELSEFERAMQVVRDRELEETRYERDDRNRGYYDDRYDQGYGRDPRDNRGGRYGRR